MKVTFDTNGLDRAARPKCHPKDPQEPQFVKVHDAIVAGGVKGYFSETIVTLEGIENKDRIAVLGGTRVDPQVYTAGQDTLHINLTVRQDRNPLHPEHSERIQTALKIGMRALRRPARPGWNRIDDFDGSFFEPDESEANATERLKRTAEVTNAIEARGLGFALVKALATSFAERDRAEIAKQQEEEFARLNEMLAPIRLPRMPFEEPWFTSLLRAKGIHEERQVQRAVAEWADADSIASHIGYGLNLFCTEDQGRGAGAPSVFDATNRAWLEATYGVKFVTLSELARMI